MNNDFRKTPPQALAPIAFDIPGAHRTTLSNGLRVVLFSDPRLPLVSGRLVFAYGDINDPAGETGITSATAAMLNEGTENYSSRQLAEEVERLGASLGASSGADSTVIAASALSLYTSEIFRLLKEVATAPTFPEDELELYKQNTVEGLKFQRSQPSFLADEQFAKAIYGDHPYAVVSPDSSDIERLTRDMLVDHHREVFNPGNGCLIAVGDFDNEELTSFLEDEFGGWSGASDHENVFPKLPSRSNRRLIVVDRPGSSQANILIGNSAVERSHPDYFPLLVLNQVLGAGASSRLFMNLREEKGYTYGAYSKFTARRFGGDFEASAEVRLDVVGDSLKEFMRELTRVREEDVPETELRDAVNYLTGVFPLRAETQEGLTNLLVHQEVYGLPEDYLRSYRDRVSEVTVEQVRAAAIRHIRPDEFTFVIVGDAKDILGQASEFADDVVVVDTDGKPSVTETAESETADVSGSWKMTVHFQGKEVSAAIEIEVADGQYSGRVSTPIGEGKIVSGEVNGNIVKMTSELEVWGRSMEVTVTAAVEGDQMSGELSAAALGAPLKFEASRQ